MSPHPAENIWLPESIAETGHWHTADGIRLPYRHWQTSACSPPKAIVVVVHGIGGASIDFEPSARAMAANGFEVFGIELRGQGNHPEPRARGDIRHHQLWLRDLHHFSAAIIRGGIGSPAVIPRDSVPVVWFGESLGALIVLHAATLAQGADLNPPDAIVISSPVVGFRESLPKWQEWLLRALARLAPRRRIDLASLGKEQDNGLTPTSDLDYLEKLPLQPHYMQVFSLRLLRHVGELVVTSGEQAAAWDKPVLVQYAGKDLFTPAEATEAFLDIFPPEELEPAFYPESRHLIYHDHAADQAIGDLLNWLRRVAR